MRSFKMSIAPKLEVTSASRTMLVCYICQFVVVYIFPPHHSRGVMYAIPKFGICNVIIEI